MFADRDLTACDDLLAPDYVDHDAAPDTPPGPAATRAYVRDLLADHPDLRVTIDDLVATDAAVAFTATWQGTNRRTGERLDQRGLVLVLVDLAGRLRERRSRYHARP